MAIEILKINYKVEK